MKIVHISKEELIGGAGIAAFWLNKFMNECGLDSKMLVLCDSGNHDVRTEVFLKGKFSRLYYYIRHRLIQRIKIRQFHQNFTVSFGLFGYDVSNHPLVKAADVIYIHWINNEMLSIKGLESILKLGKPVFFYCHDMWLLSGCCHHAFDCEKYKERCHDCYLCPGFLFNKLVDWSYASKQKRLTGYDNMHIVTPSHWLGRCFQESALFKGVNVDVIPNLVDTRVFRPMDRDICRKRLNLPDSDVRLIMFAANVGHANPFKGWSYLIDALNVIQYHERIEVIVVGSSISAEDMSSIPFKARFFGMIRDPEMMCELYNASDVFAMPSLAENFPLTILESLSCGTPVTAFNVGGIPDQVVTGNTGYLAEYKNAEDFAHGLEYCLGTFGNNFSCKENISNASSRFSPKAIVEKHVLMIERYASL